jgi:hypothetical protein
MEPYWKFWSYTETRLYFRQPATEWIHLECPVADADIPLDSPEVTACTPSQAIGRFILEVGILEEANKE